MNDKKFFEKGYLNFSARDTVADLAKPID